MRKLIIDLMLAAVACYCTSADAQSNRDEGVTKIEQALTQPHLKWKCIKVYTPSPSGEPSPETPKGTRYQFRCKQENVEISVFIFYGEHRSDAEKELALSQRLQVNESKRVEGIGEDGYELAKDRFAWITFRKANVYCKVTVAIQNLPDPDEPSEPEPPSIEDLRQTARLFARLVVKKIPSKYLGAD